MQYDILWFDVSVNDFQGVNFVDCFTDLFHQEGHFSFGQIGVLFQVIIQLPTCTHFQDNVNVLYIIKIPVHLDDIGVVQENLDLKLPDKLLGDFLLHQQFLLYHFKGAHET